MDSSAVIAELEQAHLRGRGGGGLPAARKWAIAAAQEGPEKYPICNGDEGDPGAFMDRSIMEGDPHSVIEGMVIAGYAIGASQGFIYVRAEYPLAVQRMQKAVRAANEWGLLGENILDSGFAFQIAIKQGAGAFVCGEETALIASIEGQRGMPRPKPPFPSVAGLWKKPTVINNVETLANVPRVLRQGAQWFKESGYFGEPWDQNLCPCRRRGQHWFNRSTHGPQHPGHCVQDRWRSAQRRRTQSCADRRSVWGLPAQRAIGHPLGL